MTTQELLDFIHIARDLHDRFVETQRRALPFFEEEDALHWANREQIEARFILDRTNEQNRLGTFWHQTAAWARRNFAMSTERRRHQKTINHIEETYIKDHESALRSSKIKAHNAVEQFIGSSEENE